MTLRERFANWLTGGAITARDIRISVLVIKCDRMRDHLLHIKHLETPKMAHVGKKAVGLAKKGLGQ